MKPAIQALKRYWPLAILFVLETILFAVNYTPNTILAGWDNIMPELHFPSAIIRSLAGVWVEYRGAGLFDGMSHVANLIHTFVILGLSVLLPTTLLRYTFTFLTHLAGGIGVYALIQSLLDDLHTNHRKTLSVLGALFYMLNLMTIQMFYAPLEAFSVHFASLPWLAWSLMKYYKNNTRKSLFIFLGIALLSTPQYFVTPFVFPVFILLGAISLVQFIQNHHIAPRLAVALIGFILVNAFWMLPYIAGLPHNAPVIANAKINQMSNDDIFARNQEFGDLKDVLLLRGFSLNYQDLGKNDTFSFMMAPWRSYINNPLILIVSGVIALICLFGLAATFRSKNRQFIGFAVVFLACFILLGNDIPVVRNVTFWFQQIIPFFRDAFRFPFTKFSLLFALSYSVLFVIGITSLIRLVKSNRAKLILITVCIAAVLLLSFPAFQGNFLYPNLRIAIPSDYFSLMNYMQHQNPNARIALLPQPDYWSWKFYRFGYRGSGFLWMGLPQATMDRAFDPWSNTNENYYWELSRALYAKDKGALLSVFSKYDIQYILIDNYQTTTDNSRALFSEETKDLLASMPTIRLLRTFGQLSLYERNGIEANSYISLITNAPSVYPQYQWTDNDVAYQTLGNYIAVPDRSEADIVYPYRSLFTKRSVNEREFSIQETPTAITVASTRVATAASILKKNDLMYDSDGTNNLSSQFVLQCGLLEEGTTQALNKAGPDGAFLEFNALNQRNCLSFETGNLTHREGYLVAVESRHETGKPMLFSLINETAKHIELETLLPTDTTWQTTYFVLPPLASDGLGYSVYFTNDSIGRYETTNDIKRIRIYKIPYNLMVNMKVFTRQDQPSSQTTQPTISHPNPAYYRVQLTKSVNEPSTLILSQSYDSDWLALVPNRTFPFIRPAGTHVLVNNWANGWNLPASNTPTTVYIFFWPQILEWIGFILLPLPFLFIKKLAN